MTIPVRFMAVILPSYSTMLSTAIITVPGGLKPLSWERESAGPGSNFARTGNPDHPGLPHWPAYTSAQGATMVFDNRCEIRNSPEKEGLALIAAS